MEYIREQNLQEVSNFLNSFPKLLETIRILLINIISYLYYYIVIAQ